MAAPTVSIAHPVQTAPPPRDPRTERERWCQCTRKRRVYPTRDRAERAAAIRTKHDQVNGIEARPWTAYACRFCGSYHVGHERKVEPCGICDVPHRCHCPRLKSYCDACPALGALAANIDGQIQAAEGRP